MRRLICLITAAALLFGMTSCRTESPPYILFVYNSERMTETDLAAMESLRNLYPGYETVLTDTVGLKTAAEVHLTLQAICQRRNANPAGIQIFGTPAAVPAFVLRYDPAGFFAEHDRFVSDYFYANFENAPENLNGISPHRIAETLDEIDILPDFPVVRLPLEAGTFTDFFEKYREFLRLREKSACVHISLSSPILPVGWYSVAMDDTGYLLMRARDEWGLLTSLQSFGTTEGVYASTLPLAGSCAAENWAHLTNTAHCEIYHAGHAGRNALLETVFDGSGKNEYHCRPILSTGTVNKILDGMPYYLNTFGCSPAEGLSDNVITAALQGRCVGAFASTTPVNNVDIDCMLSAEEYAAGYTHYSLLYGYLAARHSGATRAAAFHQGQKQIALSLTENEKSISARSLETNLVNLLGIHNLGLLDP